MEKHLCCLDRMVDAIECFRPYLQAILTGSRESTYRDWQDFYLPTQAELPLRVQTCLPSQASSQLREEKREQMEVLNGLRKYASDHVLVVGKPGSGKSTSLRRLRWEEARRCCEAQEQGNSEALQIPVFLELRDFHYDSVLQLIQRSLQQGKLRLSEAEIEDLLFDGRLLLLFDGLNELPSDAAWRKVDDFRQDYAETPMIFSTRELGAGADLGIEKKLEMMPLTEPQMRQFIEKRLPGQAEDLLRQIHDRLRELAETPLLLKLLCDVFAQKGQIPKNRGELFRKEFARRYEEFKPLRGRISEDSRRFAPELLQYLAFVMIQGDPHSDPCKPTPPLLTISRTKAEQILTVFLAGGREPDRETKAKAKEWLEDLLEYHLLQVANDPDKIEFHHQLFQEYYAAEWLLLQLTTFSDEQLKYYFLNYLKWTETIGLMLGLIDENDFGGRGREQAIRVVRLALGIETQPTVDLMLGARLAGEVKSQFQEQAVESVLEKIETLQGHELLKIELLGVTRSNKSISRLHQVMEVPNGYTHQCAILALEKIGSDLAISVLLETAKHPNPETRSTAIEALGRLHSEQVIPSLIEAIKDPISFVRSSAVIALREIGSQQAIPGLLKALEDPNPIVREYAARSLAEVPALLELEQASLEQVVLFLIKVVENQKKVVKKDQDDYVSEYTLKDEVKSI